MMSAARQLDLMEIAGRIVRVITAHALHVSEGVLEAEYGQSTACKYS